MFQEVSPLFPPNRRPRIPLGGLPHPDIVLDKSHLVQGLAQRLPAHNGCIPRPAVWREYQSRAGQIELPFTITFPFVISVRNEPRIASLRSSTGRLCQKPSGSAPARVFPRGGSDEDTLESQVGSLLG